ncbi:DUF5681 domain-containing protein [Acidisoma cladoniae]|uniref:DUF5681 domain-containing protein n=1 Tax=Acidisoma cladoniae TaxID=3040935 RepID=UPI00254C10C1|nr:DUF5681 domain-containing protein [Acidisoma sp. PAMC 29798]
MTEDADHKAQRPAHLFAPGQSGNPKGRTPGTRNKTTVAIEALLDGQAEAITQKAIDLAMMGDTVALKLVLERIAPLRRGRPVRFEVPTLNRAVDITEALGSVIAAAAAGELTPEEAATLAGIYDTKRRAIETVDIERRLAAIEERANR